MTAPELDRKPNMSQYQLGTFFTTALISLMSLINTLDPRTHDSRGSGSTLTSVLSVRVIVMVIYFSFKGLQVTAV